MLEALQLCMKRSYKLRLYKSKGQYIDNYVDKLSLSHQYHALPDPSKGLQSHSKFFVLILLQMSKKKKTFNLNIMKMCIHKNPGTWQKAF